VISEESFWPKWIETMKLRAALGESGKAPGAFDAVRTWDPIAADEGTPAFTPAQRGNPNLGPERTREIEAGFDMSTLKERLGIEFTAYRTRTLGALIGVAYPPSEGFTLNQLENVGTLQNRGLELGVNLGLVRTAAVDWNARVNVTAMKSKTIDTEGREISTGLATYVKEGYPVPAYFGTKVTNPKAIADPILQENAFLGAVYPTRIIGAGTTLTLWKNVTLDVLGEFQRGAYLNNFVGYQNALRGIWRPCFDVQAKLRAAKAGDASALNGVTALQRARCAIDREKQNSNYWIEKADFFKLRSVSLTYDLPQRLVRFGRATSLTLAGRNLYRSTKYSGTDPEDQDASDAAGRLGRRDYYNLPPARSVQASLRVTF
jgi:outer membrane receptor protein involved in Fe transport